MESKSLIRCAGLACIALALAVVQGCAADAGGEAAKAEIDGAFDDQLIAAGESGADTVNRPTLVGELVQGQRGTASFGAGARYLAWHFAAAAGDEVELKSHGVGGNVIDTVLTLYHATPTGRPEGRSIALNDDVAWDDLGSAIDFTAVEAGRYVAVVRRYDRGATGDIELELSGSGAPSVRHCGGILGQLCPAGTMCVFPDGFCGVPDAQGTCTVPGAFCTGEVQPVCGCDGVTYDNRCEAARARKSIAHEGACD